MEDDEELRYKVELGSTIYITTNNTELYREVCKFSDKYLGRFNIRLCQYMDDMDKDVIKFEVDDEFY